MIFIFIITLLQRAASGTRRLGSGAASRNSSAGSGMFSEEVHVFPSLVCLCIRPAYIYIYIYTCIRMYMLIYIHVCIPVRIPMACNNILMCT